MFLFCSLVKPDLAAEPAERTGVVWWRCGGIGDGVMTDESTVPLEQGGTVGFCRQRAMECLEAAETARDLPSRDDWIELANLWTHMALSANRLLPAAAAKRDSA
jgi:hypothetical protein